MADGAALAMTPQVRGLFGGAAPVGDATGTTLTDGTPARPSGQQPSTVRTYTEQNESVDLDTVSGATATSTSCRQSLQAALDRAR
ncbi:FMN-binding protein [Micromonospora rubida]|uniref:FMN-binding protein n=1 Tax=Micromonospora rubida TaxID=2697657 RepID=A0ABW7SMD2_9ACTN